jgi:hypothetical protein
MIRINAYQREDLWLIKGSLVMVTVCLFLVGGIFWGANYFDKSAAAGLQQARNQMNNISNAMAKIQSDEGTASQYIDKYLTLQTNGVIGAEDRLQLLELFAQIRNEHELFPIRIDIGEQAELTLPYASNSDGSGPPVKLRSSVLEISLPLLHEEDLSHLLDDLLASPHLLQPARCAITANDESNTNFYFLDKHFTASCSMYWYTFNVSAPAEAQP